MTKPRGIPKGARKLQINNVDWHYLVGKPPSLHVIIWDANGKKFLTKGETLLGYDPLKAPTDSNVVSSAIKPSDIRSYIFSDILNEVDLKKSSTKNTKPPRIERLETMIKNLSCSDMSVYIGLYTDKSQMLGLDVPALDIKTRRAIRNALQTLLEKEEENAGQS